jgi:hypothetical protein
MSARGSLKRQSRFLAAGAAAPAVLLLGHLLPAEGPGLALRLAGAAACVLLLPGAFLLRAVSWPSSIAVAVAASLALSLGVVTLALALVFAVGASIILAVVVIVAVTLCAAVAATLRGQSTPLSRRECRALAGVLGAAIPFAGIVWWSAGLTGDAFFHLARARKLAEFDSLDALTTVSEFKDGGLHPGYAFPLWQGIDALVARLAGADVIDVFLYLPAVLVPLAFVLAFGAGSVVFDSRIGGLVLVGTQVAYFGFLWSDGDRAGTGIYEITSQPHPASHLLLATAALALVFAFRAEGGWTLLISASLAGLSLTLVHPTYTPFLALVLAGFVVARAVLVRGWERGLTRTVLALGVILVPIALFTVVVLPVLRQTDAWIPSSADRARSIAEYGNAFTTVGDWLIMAPDAIARGGAVVVAGLLAVPLAGFAARRPWSAFVLGGSLAVLLVLLIPPVFTAFSDAVSIMQARRLVQFLPIAYAVAGACIVLSRLRALGVGLAGGVGVALVLFYPGEFTKVVVKGGPGWAVAVAVAGGITALGAGALLRPRGSTPSRWTAAIAAAFVLPVAVAGLAGLMAGSPPRRLTPGVVDAVRSQTAPGDVVFSEGLTAYVLAGFAPVYINASPPGHGGLAPENRANARSSAARRFFGSHRLTDAQRSAILERYSADWLLVDKRGPYPQAFLRHLRPVYEDALFALYPIDRELGD